jgi:toxin YoeB
MKKLFKLIEELKIHPERGTGQPEQLKHALTGLWSRRVNQTHRLVYAIDNDKVKVYVIGAFGHYS